MLTEWGNKPTRHTSTEKYTNENIYARCQSSTGYLAWKWYHNGYLRLVQLSTTEWLNAISVIHVTLQSHIGGLVQDCSISSALTTELLQSCIKPLIYSIVYIDDEVSLFRPWRVGVNRLPWASYQIRKIPGCACTRNAGNIFPRHWLQKKLLVNDLGMYHGTCVTHVPWGMPGSLVYGGGENVPGIPGACAIRYFTYLTRGPWYRHICLSYWIQVREWETKPVGWRICFFPDGLGSDTTEHVLCCYI